MRFPSSLLVLAFATLTLGAPHSPQARHPRDAHPIKRQTDQVGSAVQGAVEALPTYGVSTNALLASGQSVSLLPLMPASKVPSDAYRSLTRNLPTILGHAIELSTHSWELGTLVEALLECYVPKLAPFEFDRTAFARDIPWAALWVVEGSLSAYDWSGSPSSDTNPEALDGLAAYLDPSTSPTPLIARPLIDGAGALGDPVAVEMGVWVLARFAMRSDVRQAMTTKLSSAQLAWACGNQLLYLRQGITSENGTISQREGEFQLWADMGSMIPPSPAYIGDDTSNDDLLSFAIEQWTLESSALLDPSTNLYRHINDFDPAFWATGNGWMVHGGMRVLASIEESGKTSAFSSQVAQVRSTLASVFTGLFGQLNQDGLLPNYMLHWNATLGGGETAGTSLTVAAYYRFITMFPDSATDDNDAAAEKAFDGVVAKIDDDGWLTSVVNPNGPWEIDSSRSPEGQSFVGMMWAARTKAGL